MSVREFARLSALLIVLMFNITQSRADAWQHTVSSRFSAELDTNPSLSPTNSRSVSRMLFEPSYTLAGKVDSSELKAGLGLQVECSSNQALSHNREGPNGFFDWLRQSDVGELGITSKYAEIATRNAGIDTTSQVPIASTRASRALSGRWNKALNERSTLAADGSYEGVSYKGGGYLDYVMRSGGVKFSYAVSERSMAFLRVSGDKYSPTGGGSSSRLGVTMLGLNMKAEWVDVTVQVGKSKGGGRIASQGSVALQYTGPRTLLSLNMDRQVLPSGLGGFVQADQVRGSWNYAWSELSHIGMDWDRLKNHAIIINNIRIASGIWLQRNLNSLWGARVYCMHNDIEGGIGASSNAVGISLMYTNPDF